MKNKVFLLSLIFISVIMLATLASSASVTKIGIGHNPSVYGNMVTWSDDTGSIHLYDLVAQKDTTISSSNSSCPDIYGNKMVWHDDSSGKPRLTVYDIPSGSRSYVTQDVDQYSIPKINGNIIVWSSYDPISNQFYPDVYMHDISISKQTKIAEGYSPDVYGTKVAYS